MEFQEDNPETWINFREPSQEAWINKELTEISGLNRHGKPNLRCIWGATQKSESAADSKALKYHCGWSKREVSGYRYMEDGESRTTTVLEGLDPSIMVFPCMIQEEIGLPRWVIERWTSPEELEYAHRFETRSVAGESKVILREFPREGLYETYLIVESAEGLYRPMDRDVMTFIKMKWNHESNTTFEEREKEREVYEEGERRKTQKANDELWRQAIEFDLRLPLEEKLRREHQQEMQAKRHQEEREEAERLRFYYANTGTGSPKNTTAS